MKFSVTMTKYARRVVTVKNLYPGPRIGEQDKESRIETPTSTPKSGAALSGYSFAWK